MKQLEMKNIALTVIGLTFLLANLFGCGRGSTATQSAQPGAEPPATYALLADGTSAFREAAWVCGDPQKGLPGNTGNECVAQTQLYQEAQSACAQHRGVAQFSFSAPCVLETQDSASGIRGKTYSSSNLGSKPVATTLKIHQIDYLPCNSFEPCPMGLPAFEPVYVSSDKNGDFRIDVQPGTYQVSSADVNYTFPYKSVAVAVGKYSTVLIKGTALQSTGACVVNGQSYSIGISFSPANDCNTCTCLADGSVACTKRYCPPIAEPHSCFYGGQYYNIGSSFSPDGGCNTCSCGMDGVLSCSKKACGPTVPSPVFCSYGGRFHTVGASFLADDGCNRCVCGSDGQVSCTLLGCRAVTPKFR